MQEENKSPGPREFISVEVEVRVPTKGASGLLPAQLTLTHPPLTHHHLRTKLDQKDLPAWPPVFSLHKVSTHSAGLQDTAHSDTCLDEMAARWQRDGSEMQVMGTQPPRAPAKATPQEGTCVTIRQGMSKARCHCHDAAVMMPLWKLTNSAVSRTPLRMPATKASVLILPMEGGTDT